MRRPFPTFLLLMLAAPVWAQPMPPPPPEAVRQGLRVMMCEMQDESGTSWVPDFLMFTRQTRGLNAGRIEVFDPILQNLVRRPVAAVVTADDGKARTYGWALGNVRNQSGQSTERLDFRLTVRRVDGVARITVTAAGFDNAMQGRGRCVMPPE